MITKEITICINPTEDCSSLHIDWLGTEGLIIPCKDKNCITIAVDPNNPTQCLEGFIVCLDENGQNACKNCEPIHFRKCFCSTDNDCGDCGECNEDGICNDICTEEEIAQGKVCYPDGCKCPPNKPFLDRKTKKCSECISGTTHPDNPCLICVDGSYVTKNCGEGFVCDQQSGECIVDCSKNTNGKTRWNPVTKQCDCELGYRWSTVKQTCVLDVECKPGFKRNPVTDECEEVKCPPGYIYSIEIDDCIPKPCDKLPCSNGLDCDGIDCGCDETTKECVSCKDNPNALGCNDSCDREYCDDNTPCSKPGCTCVENECVGCDNFPCSICGSQKGCRCLDGVNCEGDNGDDGGCKDKHTLVFDDCALKSTLSLTGNCSCDGVGTSVKVNYISKTSNSNGATYKAEFEVDLRNKFVNNISGYELLNRFKESDTNINNNFPDSANCSLEIIPVYRDAAGSIFNGQTQTLSSEIKTGTSQNKETYVVFSNITIGIDQNGIVLTGYKIKAYVGDVVFEEKNCIYSREKVYETLFVESIDVTTVPRYITIKNLSSGSKRNPLLTWYRDNEVIRSLYVVPSQNGSYSDQLNGPKKLSLVEKGKQNLITPEGELISLKSYKTVWDCGCDKEKSLSTVVKCDLESWQLDKNFKVYTSDNSSVCNNVLELLKEHIPCPINQNLEYFNYGANHPSQTKYIVSIVDKAGTSKDIGVFMFHNTSATTGYFVQEGTNNKFEGFIYTHTNEIISVAIRMNHDTGCSLSESVFLDIKDVDIALSCTSKDVTAVIKSTGTNFNKVEIPSLNKTSTVLNSNELTLKDLPHKRDLKFIVTYVNNCKKEYILSKDCCSEDNLNLSVLNLVNQQKLILSTAKGKTLKNIFIFGVDYINKAVQVLQSNTEGLPFAEYSLNIADIIGLPSSLDIPVTVITVENCEYSNKVNYEEEPEITYKIVPNVICQDGKAVFELNNAKPNISFTVTTPTGSILNGTTDSTGYGKIDNVASAGNYSLTRMDGQDIDINPVTLSVVPNPTINSIEIINPLIPKCTNSDIDVLIRGTLNSTVEVIANPGNIVKTIVLSSPQTSLVGSNTVSFEFTNPGTYTISTRTVNIGTCSVVQEQSVSVVVNSITSIDSITHSCIAPISSTSDVTLTVTMAQVPQPGSSVVAKIVGTNTTYTLSPSVPANVYQGTIPQGSGKNMEVTLSNGTCSTFELYSIPTCDCDFVPIPAQLNDYYMCGSIDVPMVPLNNNYSLELYDTYNNQFIQEFLNPGVYTANQGSQISLYKIRHKSIATGCYSDWSYFSIYDGAVNLTLTGPDEITPLCVNSSITLVAQAIGNNTNNLFYKWTANGIIVQNSASNALVVTPTQVTSSYTIEVETYRQGLPSGTYDIDCNATQSKNYEVIQCCVQPITTITGNNDQCGDITLTVSNAPYTANDAFDFVVKNGNTVVFSESSTNNSIVVPNSALLPGNNTYTVESTKAGTSCTGIGNFTYNRCEGGCDCEYTYEVTEFDGNTAQIVPGAPYDFQNYYIEPATGGLFNVFLKASVTRFKNCSDGGAVPIGSSVINTAARTGLGYRISGMSSAQPVTSIDMINNGVPETIVIPSGNGNNSDALATYLTSQYPGQFTINIISSSILGIYTKSTNTGGFNPNGSYTRGGTVVNFSDSLGIANPPLTINSTTPCGTLGFTAGLSSNPIFGAPGSDRHIHIDYNNITISVNPTVPLTLLSPSFNLPSCNQSGCNPV